MFGHPSIIGVPVYKAANTFHPFSLYEVLQQTISCSFMEERVGVQEKQVRRQQGTKFLFSRVVSPCGGSVQNIIGKKR